MFGPLMVDLEGLTLSADEIEIICHPMVGGVILFQRNYHCRQQLIDLITQIRHYRKELLIAVDQEGGRVQRFVAEFTPLTALGELATHYDEQQQKTQQAVIDHATTMVSECLSVGIDFSFAPVLDLNTDISQVIAARAFHANPDVVAELGCLYIKTMQQQGMAAVAKHFPGHGSVAADSHIDSVVDQRPFTTIAEHDMKPFCHAITAGVEAVMVAHIVFSQVDKLPVGFSHHWLQKVLRQQLKFEGVIISDDLSMHSAAIYGDARARVEQALEVGCDMVLLCNDRAAVVEVLDAVKMPLSALSAHRLQAMQAKTTGGE